MLVQEYAKELSLRTRNYWGNHMLGIEESRNKNKE